MRRAIITILTGVAGLLLTLAGFSLIEISQKLILYTGILLLVVSLLSYLFRERKQNVEKLKTGGDK